MKKLVAAIAFALAGCPLPPGPPPGSDDCERAYSHLGDLGCEPLKPESGTWIDVCRNGRRNGVFELRCMNAATSLDALKACGVSCGRK
jgi:hypothetical protein